MLVIADTLFPIGLAGNDGLDPLLFEVGSERVGVIALIGEKLGDAWNQADTGFGDHAIGSVSRSEDEDPGPTQLVDDRVNLAVSAAFGEPDRLRLRPPFPPLAQRWIFM